MKNTLFTLLILSFSSILSAKNYDGLKLDDERTINGVKLYSGKIEDLRTYLAEVEDSIEASFENVFQRVVRFEDRCNNDYRDKRKYFSKDMECPLHNPNLVESYPIRNIKNNYAKMENEVDRFLLRRNIYNREAFGYYDEIIVRRWKEKGKNKAVVTYRLLTDKEAALYLERPEPMNSAFSHISGTYTLTEGDEVTHIHLTYASKTDHWMLNKGVAVGLLFKNIAKGTLNTLKNISAAAREGLGQREI